MSFFRSLRRFIKALNKPEIDERLLVFAPFYRKLLLREHPKMDPAEVTDEIVRYALVQSYLAVGRARKVRLRSGRIRIEATEKYLSDPNIASALRHQADRKD